MIDDIRGTYPYIANGVKCATGEANIAVAYPWSGEEFASVATPSERDVARIVARAASALALTEALDRSQRSKILVALADRVEEHSEYLARAIMFETGKTIRDCRAEVVRTISTLHFGAEAVRSLVGESLGLDAQDGVGDRLAVTIPRPIGVVAAMTASNYPLLLAAHKLGPAIGAGCPFVLKPADKTPISSLMLADFLMETIWPSEAVSVIPGGITIGKALTMNEGINLISFTGSTIAGREIARQSGAVKLILELGSNAPTIVMADADLDLLVDRCMVGGFTANGQSCISVQRLLVHSSVHDAVVDAMATRMAGLIVGDPADERTDIGPVIDDTSASRIEEMIEDATARGGTILTGGRRSGRLVEPTLIAGLDSSMRLHNEEVFGPVIAVASFSGVDEAVEIANGSPYGLQAGVFTNRLDDALKMAKKLDFGSVHINEVSTFRPDQMPYGGVKASGQGKEGPRYAMQEMTEQKVVSMRGRS